MINCYVKKNTKDMRGRLSGMGLGCNNGKWMGSYLAVFLLDDGISCKWKYCGSPEYDLKNMPDFDNAVDCGDNEDLFFEIAFMNSRDNTGWYWCNVGGKRLLMKRVGGACTINAVDGATYKMETVIDGHRYHPEVLEKDTEMASVEEVIEHFKEVEKKKEEDRILITKKLLEKNGFETGAYSTLKIGEHDWLEYYHHENRLTRWCDYKDEWDNDSSQKRILFRCNAANVHELQMAFDLMHLDIKVKE